MSCVVISSFDEWWLKYAGVAFAILMVGALACLAHYFITRKK